MNEGVVANFKSRLLS